jgi:hypothetical protein
MGSDPVRIGEQLRSDAVGTWHRAEHAGHARTLRILREDLAGREEARLLFAEEVRRIRRLDHPALLRVHHVGASGERPFLLTDPIDGETLAAAAPLALAEVEALAVQLLDAAAYLEARSQVHAAPVPERLVRVEGGWRLLTFRDIRAWDELKSRKGKMWPDAGFAPPEHSREHPEPLRPMPFLSWALGGLVRFAAGGGAPCTPDGGPAPLPAGFPAPLRDVVTRLLAWEPADRPQGLPALKRALSGEGEPAPPPGAKPIQAPVPRKKRGRDRR